MRSYFDPILSMWVSSGTYLTKLLTAYNRKVESFEFEFINFFQSCLKD